MAPFKRIIIRLLRKIDDFIDGIKFSMVRVGGRGKKFPIKIATYRGFGSHQSIFLQGRVLVKKSFKKKEDKTRLDQILETYNNFESDEVPNAKLNISVGNNTYQVLSDKEGYFTLDNQLRNSLPKIKDSWYSVDITLVETPWRKMDLTTSTTVLVPPAQAKFGIITDIDDTILHTGVTSPLKWKVIYNTFFKSARRRKVFDEAAAFFNAMHLGSDNRAFNPVFYVSNSPHNLYDMIKEFLKINHLPKGPMLLRDIGIPYRLHPSGYKGHKAGSISRILDTYADMPFILIGDSGEKDTYIYHEVANDYPNRIKAIFIRDVRSPKRVKRIKNFLSTIPDLNIHIFESYRDAASLAAEHGFLNFDQYEKNQLALHRKSPPKSL